MRAVAWRGWLGRFAATPSCKKEEGALGLGVEWRKEKGVRKAVCSLNCQRELLEVVRVYETSCIQKFEESAVISDRSINTC